MIFFGNEQPFNLLDGEIDPSFKLTPFPFSAPNSTIGSTNPGLNHLAGLLLPKHIINCSGTIFPLMVVMGMSPTYHLQFPKSTINNLSVQKMYGLHIKILTAEVNLGLDYEKIQVRDGQLDYSTGMPGAKAIANAKNLSNFNSLKWDQAKVKASFDALVALKTEVDRVAPGDFVPGWSLWRVMSGLDAYHISKVLLLSGLTQIEVNAMPCGDVDTGAPTWGSTTLGQFYGVDQNKAFYNPTATLPSGMLPLSIPFNFLNETLTSSNVAQTGVVTLSSGLELEKWNHLPYNNIIVQGYWNNVNNALKDIYTPRYLMNCPGVASIWFALTGLGCDPSMNVDPQYLSNPAIQNGLKVIDELLIGEVELSFNWYTITTSQQGDGLGGAGTALMMTDGFGVGQACLTEAASIISTTPSLAWDVSRIIVQVNKLIDLSGAIRLAAPEEYDLPDWVDPSFTDWTLKPDLYSFMYTYILSHSMTLLKLTLNKLTITDADLTIPLVALLGNTANSRFNSSPFVGAGNSTYLRGLNYTQIIQPGRP